LGSCYIETVTVAELIPVLQMAVGPVVLISGVGLLILSLTNRLGRVIDRGRVLTDELRQNPESTRPNASEQVRILVRRATCCSAQFSSPCCACFSPPC